MSDANSQQWVFLDQLAGDEPSLSWGAVIVWLILYRNLHGSTVTMTAEDLSAATGRSVNTVHNKLRELRAAGFIIPAVPRTRIGTYQLSARGGI